jgi:hypothetical protein
VIFKNDENIPTDAAELLRTHGFGAETVQEESLPVPTMILSPQLSEAKIAS